jgi:hypothetical protein
MPDLQQFGDRAAWLDAQHQYMAIAQRAGQRPARHAVAVAATVDMAATAATAATGRTHLRPTPRRGAAGAVEAAGAGAAEA